MKKYIYILLLLISVISGVRLISPQIDYVKVTYDTSSSAVGAAENSVTTKNIEEKYVIVQVFLDFDYHYKANGKENDIKNKKVQFDKESRHEAEKYFKGNNESILKHLKLENYIDLYVCMYASFIEVSYEYDYFTLNKLNILASFSKNPYVESINVMEITDAFTPSLVGSSYHSGYYEIYQDRSKTGNGAVVGILESGIIDDDHPNLQNTDIQIRSSIYNILASEDHATKMALIIAGENGIAPDAVLKNAFLNGSMSDEMEWLINRGVDIVNMSFGQEDPDGIYESNAAYVDYIAYTYDVLLVVAAGNEGDSTGNVTTPGIGYNVITVGSVASNGECNSFSSDTVIDGPVKPTISARGDNVELFDEYQTAVTGTSAATAVCSGILSLVLEDYPTLPSNRQLLVALMCANADFYSINGAYYDNGFSYGTGAGRIDYTNMITNYDNARMFLNNSKNDGDTFAHQSLFLRRGETLRVAIAYLAKSTGTVSSLAFTDYDVYLLNPDGEVVEGANSIDSVVELFTYTVTQTGTYQYYVRQCSDRAVTSEKIGIAHRIFTI